MPDENDSESASTEPRKAADSGPLPIALELDGVTGRGLSDSTSLLQDFDLQLRSGDLAVVLAGRRTSSLLCDLAQGLASPEKGKVLFLGEDWDSMNADHALEQRGRIGRAFAQSEWISSLDMDENLLLAQRHHSTRSTADLMLDAAGLARMFRLESIPSCPPEAVRYRDRQVFQLVRVFLGSPRLVLLDRADRDLPRTALEPLQKVVASARLNGAAVLWITDNRHVAENLSKTSELSYTADETGIIPWGATT